MKVNIKVVIPLLVSCLPLVLSACSDGDSDADGQGDASSDLQGDASTHVQGDASADVQSDARADVQGDAASDSGQLDSGNDGSKLDSSGDGEQQTDSEGNNDGSGCSQEPSCEGNYFVGCKDGQRVTIECDGEYLICDEKQGGCVPRKCNPACKNTDAPDGEYCRADGKCSPKIFETVWKIQDDDLSIMLPYYEKDKKAKCDYKVLWGDEGAGNDFSKAEHITKCETRRGKPLHTYKKTGTYHIKIIGTYNGWGTEQYDIYDYRLDRLVSVVSFGPVGLSRGAFRKIGDVSMPEKDSPDSTKWTDGYQLFYKAESFNAKINHWDTSNVINMADMFYSAKKFNQPLDKWNTSKVTNMSHMFGFAETFNQLIDKWDTSKVTDMSHMFSFAASFDKPLNTWDTSNVTTMRSTFSSARVFNQPLNKWNTSNVTNMSWMFDGAKAFNQPLNKWDTSKVTTMMYMFAWDDKFDQDLSAWKLKQTVDLKEIFMYSGITKDNFCKLAKLPVWKDNLKKLGKNYTCP